jgi:hypothetical protein
LLRLWPVFPLLDPSIHLTDRLTAICWAPCASEDRTLGYSSIPPSGNRLS